MIILQWLREGEGKVSQELRERGEGGARERERKPLDIHTVDILSHMLGVNVEQGVGLITASAGMDKNNVIKMTGY